MKRVFLLFALILSVGVIFAQSKKKPVKKATTVKKPIETAILPITDTTIVVKPKRKPIQDGYVYVDSMITDSAVTYPKVEMKDVVYVKRVWRDIDFRDPGNKVLNSPVVNLVGTIFRAVSAGELDMYDPNDEDFKKDPITNSSDAEMEKKYGKKTSLADETFLGVTTKEDKDGNVGPALNASDDTYFYQNFYKMRLKEDWILDGKRGVFEPRIVGVALIRKPDNATGASIAPIAGAPTNLDGSPIAVPPVALDAANVPEPEGAVIGWFPFEELREVLAKVKIPNDDNDFSGITYDDVFMKRLFYSNITKVSTAGDKLKELTINGRKLTPKELLLESERIKKQMSDFEQGLWEY